MQAGSNAYPGELASPDQIRMLADEYRRAAHALSSLGQRGKPLTWAPFRLSAIQAIELYLNALWLHQGQSPMRVRSLQHDLAARLELAHAAGLRLRKRTLEHLGSLSRNREYLTTRYGPELAASYSQINRLSATLDEIATKVAIIVARPDRRTD